MGRTPIPPGLKILQGRGNGRDSGGRPVPVPPALERGLPDPPAWLPPEVAAMWEVLAPLVDDLEVAKPQDGLAFTVLCELAATYARAVVALYAQRELLANPKTGCVHKNPLIAVVETARRDLLRFLREFTLTPQAEALLGKLPASDDNDEDDPFAAGGGYDQSAAELKEQRLARARNESPSFSEIDSGDTKMRSLGRVRADTTRQSPGRKKYEASSIAAGARRQAKRDRR